MVNILIKSFWRVQGTFFQKGSLAVGDKFDGKFRILAIFLFLSWGILSGMTPGQAEDSTEKVKWLTEHTIPIRSLDPKDGDFSDLMPLVKAIGNARIVQLGENTHGEGPTFLAKGRLIRFLHQIMGFEVLAWEAGFFDCRWLDAALRSDIPIHEAAQQALYQLWSNSAEVMQVLEYARSTQSTPIPLNLAGFDSRVSTKAGREVLFPQFIFYIFDRLDPKILSAKDREDFATMSVRLVPLDYYNIPGKREFNPEVAERLVKVLDQNKEKMLSYSSPREIEFVRQSLVSFLNMGRALRESSTIVSDKEEAPKDRYTRDTAMAENILWLYRTYFPGRKIIIWAHNFHIGEDLWASGIQPEIKEKLRKLKNNGPHGRFLNRELGDQVYTIGFTGYQGSWGYVNEKPETLSASKPGSLDDLLHQTGNSLLFLDFHGLEPTHWLRKPMTGRFSFWEEQVFDWTRLYDGVVFIDTMTPATPVVK